MTRMSQDIIDRRRRMLDAAEMGIKPSTFLKEMSEELVRDVTDPEEQNREYEKVYNRLNTDWYNRRLGPNGWLRKIEEIDGIEDVIHRQLYQVRQIQFYATRMIKDLKEMSPMMRIMAMGKLESSINLERKILGIRPMVQPDVMTPTQMVEAQVRLQADQFYDLLNAADPDLTQEIVSKMIRVSDLPDVNLNQHK